jgi:hypothetical protein
MVTSKTLSAIGSTSAPFRAPQRPKTNATEMQDVFVLRIKALQAAERIAGWPSGCSYYPQPVTVKV